MKKYIILLIIVILVFPEITFSSSDNKGNKKLNVSKSYNLFEKTDYNSSLAPDGTKFIKLNTSVQRDLFNKRVNHISVSIPFGNKNIILELTKANVLTDDFTLGIISNTGQNFVNYSDGVHYSGHIKDKEKSLAAISIFNNHVMGVISDESGNYNLSSANDNNNYALINDRDLNFNSNFTCGTDDYDPKFSPSKNKFHNNIIKQTDNSSGGTVNIYFECDFKMYQDFSSNTDSVMNYVSGFFNVVRTLYQNESIPILISQVFIWTTTDPYIALPTTLQILKRFGVIRQNNFNGHLAHLISTRVPNIGGIGWLDVICYPYSAADSSGPFAYSSINTTYGNFPIWSYTVQVVAHELGHNFASKHTHACVWPIPGGIGALDSCYATEGGCYVGPPIARVGTIMSYCIFVAGGSISFTLGFGPRPGDTIRTAYSTAPCVIGIHNISSEIPTEYKLMQNYPNPFNPITNIKFQITKSEFVKLIVYDATGKEIETLVNQNLNAGAYNYDWDSGNNSSGVYFYKIETSEFSQTKKMVLIK